MPRLFVSFFFTLILAVISSPTAKAQLIDCSGGCTDTVYGLNSDVSNSETTSDTSTFTYTRVGPGDGSCGPERFFKVGGIATLREQNSCAVSSTNRCLVEVPVAPGSSSNFTGAEALQDLGPLGLLAFSNNVDYNFDGSVGFRQLLGSCVNDGGEACGLDSDCPGGEVGDCQSTCASSPGTLCASNADCAAEDCRTEIEWDGVGTCSDKATLCFTDGDCAAGAVCLDGMIYEFGGCGCCQSQVGVVCDIFGAAEYPTITCPQTAQSILNRVNAPDWIFEGGAGTAWDMEPVLVPGQQEGTCLQNPSRACGTEGSLNAGAQNGKCTAGAPCTKGDPVNPSLASECDDVAFGGIAGDVCDLMDDGLRSLESVAAVNPDGAQNPAVCGQNLFSMAGTPGVGCSIGVDLPFGDPQPGCQLINYGPEGRPDLNCNGVDDALDGRCAPDGDGFCDTDADCASGNCVNGGDLCRFLSEVEPFLDSNNDDLGDQCQCGDGNGDGSITGLDIAAVALCANAAAACNSTLVDATGDNATTGEDIGGVVAVVNGAILPSELACIRNLDTSNGM